jgi:hypothetical protein
VRPAQAKVVCQIPFQPIAGCSGSHLSSQLLQDSLRQENFSLGKNCSKTARAKRAGVMAQAVQCLPSKRLVLSSNHSIAKRKTKQKTLGILIGLRSDNRLICDN